MGREIDDSLISAVADAGVATRVYPHGGVVFVKDDEADCAYVVKSGRVEIRETGRALERVRPGEIFGEVGMIDGGPRSASAVAVGPTEVHAIDRATFDRLVRDDPKFTMAIMREMARRLRLTNAQQRPSTDLPLAPRQLDRGSLR